MARDEDFAQTMLDMQEEPPTYSERFSEWSPTREGLARVEDAIRGLTAVEMLLQGQKPPAWQPARRPVSAYERIKHQRKRAEHLSIVDRLLPGGGTSG